MFEIKYRIVEDIDEFLLITPEVFDDNFRDFEGQIELNFNGNKIGYVFEGEISKEMLKVGCYQDEYLLIWFENLIQGVKLLKENNYLILSEIECPNWIEFKRMGDSISVKEFREIPHNLSKRESFSSKPPISVSPLSEIIVLDTGETYTKDVEMESTNFNETFISHTEFEQEIKRKSKIFLNEISEIFPNLINSKTIKKFEKMLCSIDD